MVELNDGVDYVRMNIFQTDGKSLGNYEPVDGSIQINLNEIWDDVKESEFVNSEGVLIQKIIDVLGHELNHKWFVWGMGADFIETFNEQDERVMRCISDWINFGKISNFTRYDYK